MKIDTKHIAFTSVASEVERLRVKGTFDGEDLADLMKELANLFEHAGQALPGSHARSVAEILPRFTNTTDQVDDLKSRLDDFLSLIDRDSWDVEGDELSAWLQQHRGRDMLMLPRGMSRKDAERVLEAHVAMNSEDGA